MMDYNNKKLRVAIVEDEPLISIFIKKIVLDMGEDIVAICYDSHSAIKRLQEEKPNLIFMDINIKGNLDGISVIRRVLMPQNPTIFFVSAYSDKETITEALETNPYNYLIKPIKEKDIQIAIALGRKEQFGYRKIVQKNLLSFSDNIHYDLTAKELKFPSNITLTLTDIKMIDFFIDNININISVEDLKESLWINKNISSSTVRDAISKLRKKIPEIQIKTNFGRGYILMH